MTFISEIHPTRIHTGEPAVLIQTARDDVLVTRPTLEAVLALTDPTARTKQVDDAFAALEQAEAEARAEGWGR